jgi:hypothetical protein
MRDSIAIKWRGGESAGYTDVFPAQLFADEGSQVVTHDVVGPRYGHYPAKCKVSVRGVTAHLDYELFPRFNNDHDMLLGVLRIVFRDPDRVSVSKVLWKPRGKSFKPAKVAVVEYSLPRFGSYRPPKSSANRATRRVRERPGQLRFRRLLKVVYGGRCCLSACPVPAALEGAHIDPYVGPASDYPQNGLLLRKDLHALLDSGMVAFHPVTRVAYFAPEARTWPEYKKWHGATRLRAPETPHREYGPSQGALERRWRRFVDEHGHVHQR